jgi:LacI family transcriptional regulator, galactose operon repressor
MKEPRRPTSADVAALAGVSRTTVSFVLNGRANSGISEETRGRVLRAAEELGYHVHGPARALAEGQSRVIGLVLLQRQDQVGSDALLEETLLGIASEARSDGYKVLVEAVSPDGHRYADLVRSHRVDGLIVSGPRANDRELQGIIRDGFPVILQGSLPGLAAPSVDVDNRTGAAAATSYLAGLGHRRIGCISHAPLDFTAASDRLAGYRDALEERSIPFDERLVASGAFDAASGYAAMRDLLTRAHDLTAVFIASDIVAFGALSAIREAGHRVPQDISVVGFDDIPLARHFDPPLTTVRIPARDLGAAAGRALIDRLAGRPATTRTLLATELVVRSSTAVAT